MKKEAKKETKKSSAFSLKKELSLTPGYLLLFIWLGFTVVLIGWIFAASLSTSREIFKGEVLKFASGFHWENYATAWKTQNVSVFFMNSLLYATVSSVLVILISAPASCSISLYFFRK